MKHSILNFILLTALPIGALSARTIPTHAAADRVLGHNDLNGNQVVSLAASLNSPSGLAIDPTTGKVFVADTFNHRILRFPNAASITNGAAAEAVLGQANLTTTPVEAVTAQGMERPGALFVDSLGRLWVADRNNARVLRFSSASTLANHSPADRVYGQPDFTSNQFNVTASGMINPTGVWVDSGDRLWVADEASCRVLRFDNISSKPNGAAADGVLGQPDLTSGVQGSGATGLERPMAIAISNRGSLFVACERGNRVVRFDQAASLPNGAAASAVFGQPDFDTTTAGTGPGGLSNPVGLAISKTDSLWVCDQFNSRLLRIDGASTRVSGTPAIAVVGQPDFTSVTGGLSAQAINYPQGGMAVDSEGNLWMTDRYNNRALRFPATVSNPTLAVASEVPKKTRQRSISIRGSAKDPEGISRVRYSLNDGPFRRATGGQRWNFSQNLKKGENRITIIAEDPWGDLSKERTLRIIRK